MDKPDFVCTKLADMSVTMRSQADRNMCLLRGKAVLNEEDKDFIFIQNEPRGPRSIEVGRSSHSRMVRRPDGNYTLTFRFSACEKFLREQLISEIREVVKIAQDDKKLQDKKGKKNEKDIQKV